MPSKYSHSVVLASYSSRGIVGLANDEKRGNQKPVKPSRVLAGKSPQPHQPDLAMKPGPRASPGSSYHARLSTLSPKSPAQRFLKGKYGLFTSSTATTQRDSKKEISTNVRSMGATEGSRPSTRERMVILDSDSEETVGGIAVNSFQSHVSGPANRVFPACSPTASPPGPQAESPDLNTHRSPSRAGETLPDHTDSGFLSLDETPASHVAAQKLSIGQSAIRSKRRSKSSKAVRHNDTLHNNPRLQTPAQPSRLEETGRQTLSRANISFIDLSDDEVSGKSHAHTPRSSLDKSPSTHTLTSEVVLPGSTLFNASTGLRLHDIDGSLTLGTRRATQDKLANGTIWHGSLPEPQVRKRPLSMGNSYHEALPLHKTVMLRRRQTEEFIKPAVSRSPTLEPRDLSWLLLDVGLDDQLQDDDHDEDQTLPHITLESPDSEAHAEVTIAGLESSSSSPDPSRLEHVEIDFSKRANRTKNGLSYYLPDDATTNVYLHRHKYDSAHDYPAQNDLRRKSLPPLSTSWSSRRGEENLWSPNPVKSAPTSAQGEVRHQARISVLNSSPAKPEPELQTCPVTELSDQPTLRPKLKSEEEMRMKIPTPIPSPSQSETSPKMSAKRMVKSSSGPTHRAHRVSWPATVPEFGVPSITRHDESTPHIHEQCESTLDSRLTSASTQKQKIGPNAIRRLASFPRFTRLGIPAQQEKDEAHTRVMENQQEEDDNWALPSIPISKEAASRAKLLELLAIEAEAESRHESKASKPWREYPPDLSSQLRNVDSQTGHSSDLDDVISLFSDAHDIPIDIQADYSHDVHTMGDEVEDDPDAALPPPDISRHRADRSSSRNAHNRLSQSSLTALPRMANAKIAIHRLSRTTWDDITKQMPWASTPTSSASAPAKTTIRQEKQAKKARMKTAMRAFWGRMRRHIEN
ncbi:hypothetical protein Z517_01334 [Fonsecaea pedrosoi CBS 271.37]|uniref:Unplaced genomic scaffold supercont1.1, whole genome shotgun sequence n=1 Tax=Fonsecaea pedrosoi CBS 271.37 TaxID=1442368 RepID=A0A0D2E799_9EURO|nr:uncharacterized protein Z517_01334 [Fonsecaea pedrosoi CBS 271.37]KIW85941.1 hypothetical protein Z517_01334 [Fonsecaea pedrosoi CBS 271.37]